MGNLKKAPVWAFAALGLGLFATAAAGQGKSASLAGTWKLNAEKTQEAAAEARRKDAEVPTVPMGFRAAGGGAGSGNPVGRSGGSVPAGPNVLGALTLYSRPQPELVIVQTDSTISISDPRGTPRTYKLDGKKETEPLANGETMEIVAKFKDGKLTTERKMGSSGTVREVYSINSATQTLLVEVRFTGPQISPPITQLRIYDGTPAGGN